MSNERHSYHLTTDGYLRAWGQFLLGICALLGIVIYRWSGWETLLVMIPMVFVMLLLILPGTAFSFISHRSPALIISSRGLYWQGTLSGVPTTDYFLFWENIPHAEQEGTILRLKYYSGAVFNGEPMPEEPIPRNFPPDSESCLALAFLSSNAETVCAEIFERLTPHHRITKYP